ncbi:MAG TPA: hypothetical protein VHX59_00075 [Mycobacteriales bacterium]|nr:hypothetical protein [Mycobacteriales bacterium]
MTWAHRTRTDLDHARAAGFEAYFEGETPADTAPDEFSELRRSWWLYGWRAAREIDQGEGTRPGV